MKSTSLLLTTAAVVACGLSLSQAQDAPKPPPQGGERGGDPAARAEEYFKRLDTNGDGKISKEEYVEAAKKEAETRFNNLDANHDGFIDKEELQKALAAQRSRFGGRSRGEGGGERPPGGPEGAPREGRGGGGRGFGGLAELFQKVQETGSVTKEDFHKITDEQFDRLDTNHDGKITKDEIEAAMARFGRGRRGEGSEGGGARPRPGADGSNAAPQRPAADTPKPAGS